MIIIILCIHLRTHLLDILLNHRYIEGRILCLFVRGNMCRHTRLRNLETHKAERVGIHEHHTHFILLIGVGYWDTLFLFPNM